MSSPMAITCLHLIGKWGCGKSATSRSILGRKRESKRPVKKNSCTVHCEEILHPNLGTVVVCDWQGMDGTCEATRQVLGTLLDYMQSTKQNHHVLLWVYRYGELCGREDDDIFRVLVEKFGQDFIEHQTIILVTHKDNFDRDVAETDLTFKKWVEQDTGFFKTICKMCSGRCIMFDNIGRPASQVNELFHIVGNLQQIEAISNACPGNLLEPSAPSLDQVHKDVENSGTEPETQRSSHVGHVKDPNTYVGLERSIDTFSKLLTRAKEQMNKRCYSLGRLHTEVQNFHNEDFKWVKRALLREIQREIKVCKAAIPANTDIHSYLQELKQTLTKEEVNDDMEGDFVDVAQEMRLEGGK